MCLYGRGLFPECGSIEKGDGFCMKTLAELHYRILYKKNNDAGCCCRSGVTRWKQHVNGKRRPFIWWGVHVGEQPLYQGALVGPSVAVRLTLSRPSQWHSSAYRPTDLSLPCILLSISDGRPSRCVFRTCEFWKVLPNEMASYSEIYPLR